ncbi:VIT domain-containing protein [Sphingomonas sp. Leaf25]|uniref:VIT domain-containing protein n=1 Tax=Sphingomonas sp. Leaf25 TaxID=1735692 RepID=UPI0009EBEE45|nr:VIT domain-containing protein [Sphingomonas sp. Leaf25]
MARTMLVGMLAAILAATPATAQLNPSLSEAERGIRQSDTPAEATRLTIADLAIDAKLTGPVAELTLEMLLRTDAPQPHEADLVLRLPDGAIVTGYALDVGGRMIPGQLLAAPRAREVYADTVRAGIDPGLAEVTGNRFATRIFPVDRDHPRRFRLTLALPYDPARGLDLPLLRDRAIERVALTIAATGYATSPTIRFDGEAVAADGTITRTGRPLRSGLSVTGGTLAPAALLATHTNGERFFTLADAAPPPPPAPTRGGRLRIYWDRSRSHRDGAPDAEIAALVRLVDTTAPDAIDLVTFASDVPRHQVVADAAALRRALTATVYRGGSSLAGLAAMKLPAATRCVLVFDGAVTIDRAAAFVPDCPLAALTGSAGADMARLARLVRPTGGSVVRAGGDDAAAARALLVPQAVRRITDGRGTAIDTIVLPAAPGRIALAGPAPVDGTLDVTFGDGTCRRYTVQGGATGNAPAALWAVDQVAALATDPTRADAMTATARRYGVATAGLSFLVLERPDQYLTADLAPPPGFAADWMTEYRAQKAAALKERATDRASRFDEVLERWADRRRWWSGQFPVEMAKRRPGPLPVYTPVPVMAPPPPPSEPVPPPPPPPAPMEPLPPPVVQVPAPTVEIAAADAGNIVVTGSRIENGLQRRASARDRAMTIDLAERASGKPHIAALAAAAPAARLGVLAAQERAYGDTPGFYLDVADWFRAKGDTALADLLLLSALDLPLADDETRQIVAFRLERDGSHDRAVELAERLAGAIDTLRPQPRRDLALALAARGKAAGKRGRADLERAFALLTQVALDPASSDFDGIEVVALEEANALIPALEAAGGRWQLDPRLRGRLDMDARIVIGWTADDADIDLWVSEPGGERVMYSHPLSAIGGVITNDMTDGYGPEEYALRRAPAGRYGVAINGFDADRINPNGAGHVLVRLYRNYARPNEQQVMVDADLDFQKGGNRNARDGMVPVATLEVGK